MAYAGKYSVGQIVMHRGHECIVVAVWDDDGKSGVTLSPTGGYGFEIDIYDEQV